MLSLFALFIAQTPTLLPETVVVETRQAAPLADASPSVSRINVSEATEAGTNSISRLLSTVPGIFAAEQTGEGSQSSLFLRGTNSSQSAVLLDGRRLPQGFLNGYETERYRIFGLSSVQVLRGPSSSLYGANAIGGVIDLRLPQPLIDKPHAELAIEGGSFGRASLGINYVTNNAQGAGAATQGTAVTLTTSHEDGWRPNSQLDASTALIKSEWKLNPHLTFDLIGSADLSKARLPGPETAPNLTDFQNDDGWMLSPGLHYEDKDVQAAAFWSHGVMSMKSFTWGATHQGYELTHDEVTAFADWKTRTNLILGLGTTYECSRYDQRVLELNTTPYPYAKAWADTHESLGLWTHADWQATPSDRFKAALRHDTFTDFASKTTGEFSFAHKLNKELTLHAKYATAYRTPAGGELVYGTVGGVPLRPESNRGIEIGLRHEDALPNALSWTLVAFENRLTDLIDFTSTYEAYNIAQARTRGVELGIEARPAKGLRCFGSATYLETEALSTYTSLDGRPVQTGESLLARPRVNLSAGIEILPNENWTLGASLNYLRSRTDFDWNTFSRANIPDAIYYRAWVRRALGESSEVSLRIENIFGETAPPKALGYGAQPRSVYLGFTRKF